jgi:hypothetical protein
MPLELVKTIIAGAALLLAIFQALSMLQVRGMLKVLPLRPKTLAASHRWGGRLTLALVAITGLLCLYLVFGLGYTWVEVHARLHALLGASAGAVLLAKSIISRWRRAYLRHAMALGIAAGVLLGLAWIASGLRWLLLVYG